MAHHSRLIPRPGTSNRERESKYYVAPVVAAPMGQTPEPRRPRSRLSPLRSPGPESRPGTAASWATNTTGYAVAAPSVLARPLQSGLRFAAQIADFSELASRGIWTMEADEACFLDHGAVDALFDARCVDQRCPAVPERRLRFHELIATQCKGQWFVLRQAGLGAHSIAAVSAMLRDNSHVTHLDLSGNSVGLSGAHALSELLSVNGTLCVLRLQSANLGEGTAVLAKALETNNTLTALDLSGISGVHRNCVWGESTEALSRALQTNRTLAQLNLSSCGLNKGAADLFRACCSCPEGMSGCTEALTSLTLTGNQIGDEVGDALYDFFNTGRAPLQSLDLSRNNIGERAVRLLCEGLLSNVSPNSPGASLQTLNLSHNQLTSGALKSLAGVVRECPLETLRVCHNPLTGGEVDVEGFRPPPSTEGMNALMEGISVSNHGISSLHMSHCGIHALPPTVALALEASTTLRRFDIANNSFGDEDAIHIATGLAANKNLRSLNISFCGISTEGMSHFSGAIQRHAAIETIKFAQGGTRVDLAAAGILDAVSRNDSIISTDFVEGALLAVQNKLTANKKIRLKKAVPALHAARHKVYEQQRALNQTREQIDDEAKLQEKLVEAFRATRDRQKAVELAHERELQERQEERQKASDALNLAESTRSSVDSELRERKENMELELTALSRKLDKATTARQDIMSKCQKLLWEHYTQVPASKVELPPFFLPDCKMIMAPERAGGRRLTGGFGGAMMGGGGGGGDDAPKGPTGAQIGQNLMQRKSQAAEGDEASELEVELQQLIDAINKDKETCAKLEARMSTGLLASTAGKTTGKAPVPKPAAKKGKRK